MKSPLKAWRSSLVFRITGTIVALSIILIWLLGSALFSRVSSGIFDEKLKLSIADAQSTSRNTQIQLNFSKYQDKAALALVFDDILALPPKTFESSAKEIVVFSFSNIDSKFKFDGTSNLLNPKSVPAEFREITRKSSGTEWQRTNLVYLDGKTEPAIVIGQDLTISGVGKYEFYVIFSLLQQEKTMSLIFNYLLLAGFVLTFLIGATTYFVMRRLIAPIQDAARVAEELTKGNLDLRMYRSCNRDSFQMFHTNYAPRLQQFEWLLRLFMQLEIILSQRLPEAQNFLFHRLKDLNPCLQIF